jgi:hypothetical protein
MDVLFCLLTIDELYDMIMFEAFHDCDFAFEVGEEFRGEFRSNDGFDSNDRRFTLPVSQFLKHRQPKGRQT